MKPLNSYLNDVKTKLLDEHKKSLEQTVSDSIAPLRTEKNSLSKSLKEMDELYKKQIEVIGASQKREMKRRVDQAAKMKLVELAWEQVQDKFLSENKDAWYKNLVQHIPAEKGEVRISKNTPASIVKSLKQNKSGWKVTEDGTISEGMVFESDTNIVELTKESFFEELFVEFRTRIYSQISKIV